MRKTLSIFLIMLIALVMLVSCDLDNMDSNISSNSNIDIDTNSDISSTDTSSTDTSDDTKTDDENPVELSEKFGNKVYFAFEEKEIYYQEIREYEKVSDCFDVPLDANGSKKVGAYLKFIDTYDELSKYIIPAEFDASVFDSSYVVCVKQFFYDGGHEKRLVGYYELKLCEGEYSIFLDYYKSVDEAPHHQVAVPYEYTTYIVVPKDSIEYTEQLQQIVVNGRNDIEDEYDVDDNGELIPAFYELSHSFITHNQSTVFPKIPTAWVIERDSELETYYGLEYEKYSEIYFRTVLYLPNEPRYDFIITQKEIKNGNLYLTVEEYSQYTNEYLNKNDVKFYGLCIQDSSELSENFDVYILVKTVK